MSDVESEYSKLYKSLTDVSSRRFQSLLDLIQSTVVYFILALTLGSLIEKIFAIEDIEHVKQRSTLGLIILILAQLIVNAIAIYYIGIIASHITPVTNVGPHARGDRKEELSISGGIVVSLIFVACQTSLIIRIRELIDRSRL